jgi:TetR/AcrR family transcriptional regulator, regulator of autoinduction and epiphytic fitness
MKVSKEKRDEIRRSLVEAAAALFVEKGLADTSMREVAARAGVAPGTAYKYFPERDQLLSAFLEMKFGDAQAAAGALPGFASFGIKEKLQAFLETLLSAYLDEREFVALAMRSLVDAPLSSLGAMQPLKEQFTALAGGFLDQAVAAGELEAISHKSFFSTLFWDYSLLVVLYWLKDTSEGFSKTSEFIDRSLDLYVALLRSGVVDKAARLLGFFLKNHLYGNLEQLGSVMDALGQLRRDGFGGKP